MVSVGILGIGVYLPDEIRTNDWWPDNVVQGWRERTMHRVTVPEEVPGVGRRSQVIRAMAALADDPFRGTKQRRIMDAGSSAVEMETEAARRAIVAAGVALDEIDLVIGFGLCPDYLNAPDACAVHEALGLRPECLSLELSAVCNSFQVQLAFARAMVMTEQARRVLLVQSSAMSRILTGTEPESTWFGDGATAVVIGAVRNGYGVLGDAHRTQGDLHRALVHGVPGARWFDDGRCVMYSEDRAATREMLLCLGDAAHEVVGEALRRAGVIADEVSFYVSHQSTAWMQEVTQDCAGLAHAQTVEIFSSVGTLSAANIPYALAIAGEQGQLKQGDLVAMFAPGTGMTCSSTIVRWGT